MKLDMLVLEGVKENDLLAGQNDELWGFVGLSYVHLTCLKVK